MDGKLRTNVINKRYTFHVLYRKKILRSLLSRQKA